MIKKIQRTLENIVTAIFVAKEAAGLVKHNDLERVRAYLANATK